MKKAICRNRAQHMHTKTMEIKRFVNSDALHVQLPWGLEYSSAADQHQPSTATILSTFQTAILPSCQTGLKPLFAKQQSDPLTKQILPPPAIILPANQTVVLPCLSSCHFTPPHQTGLTTSPPQTILRPLPNRPVGK